MQAGDGLIRVLEREISHLVILPVFFASVGGAWAVPPLLRDGLDGAAVPEVMRPRVVDGAVRICSTPFFPADRTHVSFRLVRGGLHRSDQLGGSLTLLFLLPPRGQPCLGVKSLGFLGVGAARLPLPCFGCSRTLICESKKLRG